MNTKKGIFTRGFATRENTAVGTNLVQEKLILHCKSLISCICPDLRLHIGVNWFRLLIFKVNGEHIHLSFYFYYKGRPVWRLLIRSWQRTPAKKNYSRLPLSRRDPLKHFEISVLRHIKFAELRKIPNKQPSFTYERV